MEKFGKSQSVLRREDDRFLTGRGQYVDDNAPQGALHGYVLRSSYAHGVITALDTQEAEEANGVHLVLTAERLEKAVLSSKMEASLVKTKTVNWRRTLIDFYWPKTRCALWVSRSQWSLPINMRRRGSRRI